MSMIAELGNLASAEPINLDDYPAAREFRAPVRGRYTCRAPESFPDSAFAPNQKGDALTALVEPTIIGGEFDGVNIKYTKISSKSWGTPPVSQMGRYLKACGLTGQIGGDADSLISAIRSTAGRTYQIDLDWRAFNRNTGFRVEGMENFPKLADGTYQTWVEDPNDKNPETGEPVRCRALLEVKRFIPLQQ